ncbi:hypothetical protein LX32DRAFT_640617 [Colletotrichum zoysiae]|uniref:Uncharacterized protein n=1 Tax=Colletotrichum zoysiae TaxID=1216348 RepID=A0AAD9HGB5_9PEZI|nr:hypothetical protein LX32DRAFT_640617 [Colletotrichum zoysiae]
MSGQCSNPSLFVHANSDDRETKSGTRQEHPKTIQMGGLQMLLIRVSNKRDNGRKLTVCVDT